MLVCIPEFYIAEREIGYYIARLIKQSVQKIDPVLDGLDETQQQAVVSACSNGITYLTGAAGTGKTTTLKRIIDSYQKAGMTGSVIVPTGKGSKRADEVVNETREELIECSTTHSFLRYISNLDKYAFNRKNQINEDFILMDEATMQEVITSRDFLESVNPRKTRIVLTGDVHQLASVGPGAFFRDVINSGKVPGVVLTEIHRAAKGSGITVNANRILRGESITMKKEEDATPFNDFFFVSELDEAKAVDTIVKWVTKDLPERRGFAQNHIQVMTPGKEGIVGRKELNMKLRNSINPVSTGNKESVNGYRVGDQVMHLKNIKSENLINGDCGIVTECIHGKSGSHLVIDFGPRTGKSMTGICEFKPNMLDRIQLNFAATIHKMQGSEFPCCVMPVFRTHFRLLSRNLIYTGETRAKKLFIFIGDPKMLRIGIANTKEHKRVTQLVRCIREEVCKAA